MPIDIEAAERFVHTNARLLDRHRLAVLLHGAPVDPVLAALRAYRNPDGGFGHALEPDIRDPASQPACAYHGLDVLAGVDALGDPLVTGVAGWVAEIANPDGGVPFVLPTAADHPRAPWMQPSSGGSFLTYALAAQLQQAGSEEPWLARATDWCWAELESGVQLSANGVKFALDFLDTVPDETRAHAAIERLRPRIEADGSIAVDGGVEDERDHAARAVRASGRPQSGAVHRGAGPDRRVATLLRPPSAAARFGPRATRCRPRRVR
jgi:hypothetical protein